MYIQYEVVNSKLDWHDNLAANPSLKQNWPSTDPQVQCPSILFVGAVDTIFLECTGIYCFYFDLVESY